MAREREPRLDTAIAGAVRQGYLYTLSVLVLGVVLLVWPGEATMISYYAAAAIMILIGLWRIIRYFREDPVTARQQQLLATGAMRIIIGALMLIYADRVSEDGSGLVRAICGAGLLVVGSIRLQAAFDLKRKGYAQWYIALGFAAVCLVLGVLVYLFGEISPILLLGIGLCVEAVGDLFCRLKLSSIDRQAHRDSQTPPPPPRDERHHEDPKRDEARPSEPRHRVDWPAPPDFGDPDEDKPEAKAEEKKATAKKDG